MKKSYKIVFLGNTSVGKTTLISQYLYHKIQEPTPTIGIDFLSTILEVNGAAVRLQLWDTAGQERFQSIIGNYTRNTFLAIVVYAVDDRASLDRLKTWVEEFVLLHNRRENVRLLIAANKADLDGGSQSMIEEGERTARELEAGFVRTSALESTGIAEMAEAIRAAIAEDLERAEDELSSADANAITVQARKRCC